MLRATRVAPVQDGSANTIAVPADSPPTAVGGTSLTIGPDFTYGSESWWNGLGDVPPSGQSGFGTSRFFSRPAYQAGLTGSPIDAVEMFLELQKKRLAAATKKGKDKAA
ncbi:MAG: hypothetical protein WBQ86_18835 [Candidatus Binatus sp.]